MIQIQTKLQAKRIADIKDKISTLVVFVHKKGKKTEAMGATAHIADLLDNALVEGMSFSDLKKGIFLRGAGEAQFNNVLLVGLDEKFKDLEDVRRIAATIYQLMKTNKSRSSGIVFDGLIKGFKNSTEVARAFTEGVLLAAYKFDSYKTKKTKDKKDTENNAPDFKVDSIDFLLSAKTKQAGVSDGIKAGQIIAECVNFSRKLGDTPGNLMTPEILAHEAQEAAKGTKLKVTVWNKEKIKKERFGGLLGVSLGSAVDPRFIILEYNGAAKSKKPVCFVGKGLTFDSGGISIKPSNSMEEMKFDKCGGANVIGAILAIAKLKLKINVIGYVPSTENMPGPLANKPGDILVARNGKTVEVDNTDAEGRLILMDALSYASEQKPAVIFDAATLTGACVVALGNSYTGCFTRDKKIRQKISQAAEKSGEAVWHMPINDNFVEDMKGTYADLNNISSFKGAGASTAAAFLEQFVEKGIPWAHFDIAGTAWHVGNRLNYCPKKGASGAIIRTFVELAKLYA
ncbi:MAG: hypothetical protein A2Z20_12300 [Bdellovibrionales bacterium RBG_16_40_8]|nr:MAG: hypothetical protein A2Z20_12300 [Bdellovibrionales bacterium RBG_16_40_8]